MTLDEQLDRNHHAFRALPPGLLQIARGKIALMHDGNLEGVFDRVGQALQAGERRFTDRLYSVQKVQEPSDLGALSHGIKLWGMHNRQPSVPVAMQSDSAASRPAA